MLPDGAAAASCSSCNARKNFLPPLSFSSRPSTLPARRSLPVAQAESKRRKESVLGKGKRNFSKLQRQVDTQREKRELSERERKELNEIKRLIPDRLSDPLLDVGTGPDPYALATGRAQPETAGGQKALHKVEGIKLREWDDAMTCAELKEKYTRAYWLKCAEDEAISLHHEQRSRGTVPSYGQALAMANLMEQMHLEEDGYDPYRLPYWIRASFIMEERWGELEAEFNAAKDAVQLAEEWGVSEELQDRIDNMDPELFLGEPDAPAEPDAIDGLLDGALPGTAGFQEDTGAQVDFMRDIMPEGDDDDAELEPEAAGNIDGDTPVAD